MNLPLLPLLCAATGLCGISPSQAQRPLDHLLGVEVPECKDIAVNASELFAATIQRARLDSARLVLDYWTQRCGQTEETQRGRILLDIAERRLSDSSFFEGATGFLMNYRQRREQLRMSERDYLWNFRYHPTTEFNATVAAGGAFDQFTQRWATELAPLREQGSLERGLCLLYGPLLDTLLTQLGRGAFPGTALKSSHDRAVSEYLHKGEWYHGLFVGAWIPTGGIEVLGPHIDLGGSIGGTKKRMSYGVSLAFMILDAPKPYAIRGFPEHTLHLVRSFSGVRFTFDASRQLWAHGRSQVLGILAFGYDGFNAFDADSPEDAEGLTTAGSYNFNGGFSYAYYTNGWEYVGLRFLAHMTDYTTNRTFEQRGVPLTVHLVYGGLGATWKRSHLKALRYPLRR